MALKSVSYVIEHGRGLDKNSFLVLIVLANAVNRLKDDGIAFCGPAYLAEKTNIRDERAVRRALERLKKIGWIKLLNRSKGGRAPGEKDKEGKYKGRTNVWLLNIPRKGYDGPSSDALDMMESEAYSECDARRGGSPEMQEDRRQLEATVRSWKEAQARGMTHEQWIASMQNPGADTRVSETPANPGTGTRVINIRKPG